MGEHSKLVVSTNLNFPIMDIQNQIAKTVISCAPSHLMMGNKLINTSIHIIYNKEATLTQYIKE